MVIYHGHSIVLHSVIGVIKIFGFLRITGLRYKSMTYSQWRTYPIDFIRWSYRNFVHGCQHPLAEDGIHGQ